MPFVTIKTIQAENVNVKLLAETVDERVENPIKGINYFLQPINKENFHVQSGINNTVIELCMSENHGEERLKMFLKTICDAYEELFKPDRVVGYIQPTTKGYIYGDKAFK